MSTPHTADKVTEVASLVTLFYIEMRRCGMPWRVASALADSYLFQLMFAE